MDHSEIKFTIDPSWRLGLTDIGVDPDDALRHAELPPGLFGHSNATVTTEEYYRLWRAIEKLANDPVFPLSVGSFSSTDVFSPSLFACYCSPNLNVALKRLSKYKCLIGPMRLNVSEAEQQTSVQISGLPNNLTPPSSLIATELVFLVQLARAATREKIVPVKVETSVEIAKKADFEDYFGVAITNSNVHRLTFTARDSSKPFLSANKKMWSIFEPDLQMRLGELQRGANFRERVRVCLMETLASGQHSLIEVAERLAVSPRTLQRRLKDEGSSFQEELNALRQRLAQHYLLESSYSSAEISFLLGYDDPNSFIRAFHTWTGRTPELVRRTNRTH